MSKKTYIVESYDPATRKIERVTVTHEVYNAYRRSGWNIADNNQSFFKHEIQMSSLIGGEDGGYDNFREFIGDPEAVDNAVAERMLLEALYTCITLGEQGRVVLHTKTETEVALDDGSNESP